MPSVYEKHTNDVHLKATCAPNTPRLCGYGHALLCEDAPTL